MATREKQQQKSTLKLMKSQKGPLEAQKQESATSEAAAAKDQSPGNARRASARRTSARRTSARRVSAKGQRHSLVRTPSFMAGKLGAAAGAAIENSDSDDSELAGLCEADRLKVKKQRILREANQKSTQHLKSLIEECQARHDQMKKYIEERR